MSLKKSAKVEKSERYSVIFPKTGKAVKGITNLLQRREKQFIKAIEKLEQSPTNFQLKGIEKINNNSLGKYTIRVSKGDRLFYDVDDKNKKVYILKAGKHDLYKLG